MVTYFNRKDLVSFGNYLLSDERKERFQNYPEPPSISLEERLRNVTHADIENWMEENKKAVSD